MIGASVNRRQGGFKIGARTAMSAPLCHQIRFARTRLSALLFPYFLNPPWALRLWACKRSHALHGADEPRDARVSGSPGRRKTAPQPLKANTYCKQVKILPPEREALLKEAAPRRFNEK